MPLCLFQVLGRFLRICDVPSFDQRFKDVHMNLLRWTEALATGNKLIDEDHRELVRLANPVLESIALRHSGQVLSTALNELVAHTRDHFSREEAEMKRINFKDIDMHTAEHTTLLKQVQDMQKQLETGRKIDQMDLYRFLTKWVKDHIRKFDAELAATLETHSVSAAP